VDGTYENLINAWDHLTKLHKVNAPKDVVDEDYCGIGLTSGDIYSIETPVRLV
jgi:hypothetical protein